MKKIYSPRDFSKKSPKKSFHNSHKKFCHKCKDFFVSFFTKFQKQKTPIIKLHTPYDNQSTNDMKRKHAKWHTKSKKKNWKKWFIISLKVCAILFAIGLLFAIGVFAFFAKDLPDPDKINTRTIDESTKIYDRTGTVLLYDIHGEEKRTLIPHEEIPLVLKQATISLEDHNFYKHPGFDIRGVANAVLSNVFHTGGGRGGSTITQQFVKNSILTNERSISRK
ncbi:MAG: transglycosylase domain-containing protein, partial [Patescibacteria group bacterium]|nr:transglycosylase domain-containing protein [Patescibacteria group bacterium]